MSRDHSEEVRGTHLQPPDRLREKWPWNPEFLRLALIAPATVGIAATAALYPTFGAHALYFLFAIPTGLLLRTMFGLAGTRIEALRRAVGNRGGEIAEGLLVIGQVECPGLIILRDSELHLVPTVGDDATVALATIASVREGRWLPGKFLWGKRAFHLTTPTSTRLAFAVAESIGRRWSPRLTARQARREETPS